MIIKIVSLFLVGMVALAIFGRLKLPKLKFGGGKKCKKCGAPLINNSICICEE
jgi:Sec-independent protein translocase protein TatA